MSRRRLIVSTVLIGAVTAAVLMLAGAFGVAYVAQPGCTTCHDTKPFVEATSASAHASVTCVQCHGQQGVSARARFAGRQVFGMWIPTGSGSGRFSAAVPREACLSCHETVEQEIVAAKGLRIAHKACAADTQCADCHSATAHGAETSWAREYDMQSCLSCHERESAPVACDSCHAGRLSGQRLEKGVWRVTHGPNWKTAHGMGDTRTCSSCHPTGYCSRCHGAGVPHDGDFRVSHGAISRQADAKCESCHQKKFCSDCHKVPIPHTQKFREEHPKTAKGIEDPSCLRCHAVRDCKDCHGYHAHPGGVGPEGNSTITQGGK